MKKEVLRSIAGILIFLISVVTVIAATTLILNPESNYIDVYGHLNLTSGNLTYLNYINPSDGTSLNIDDGTLYIDSGGDLVGIGTASPNFKLHVIGTANITGGLTIPTLSGCDTIDTDANGTLKCGSDAASSGGGILNNTYAQLSQLNITGTLNVTGNSYILGNVGIGTTAPSGKLNVIGNINITGGLTVTDLASCDTIDTDANGTLKCGSDASVGGGQGLWVNATPWTYLNISYVQDLNISGVLYINATSGNVGIGTTSPTSMLHVEGDVNISGNITLPSIIDSPTDTTYRQLVFWNPNTNQLERESEMTNYWTGLNLNNANLQVTHGDTILKNLYGKNSVVFPIYPRLTGAGENLQIIPTQGSPSSGSNDVVNILPTYTQSGTAGSTDLKINRVETTLGSGTHRFVDFQVSSASKFYVDNVGGVYASGNVGIGTTAPSGKLNVIGNINITGGLTVTDLASCNTIDTDANGTLKCGSDASGGGGGQGLWVNATPWTYLNTSYTQDLNISGVIYVNASSGMVGIGTTNPGSKLEINGNVNITNGNFTIGDWEIRVNSTVIEVYVRGTREKVLDSDGTLRIKGDIITNDESI